MTKKHICCKQQPHKKALACDKGYVVAKKKQMVNKATIPRALKNAVWLEYVGKAFEAKCNVTWCATVVTPFTFEAGHNVPESKGGATNVTNLRPICAQCNKSMGAAYTIDEFSAQFQPSPPVEREVGRTAESMQQKKAGTSWWRGLFRLSCTTKSREENAPKRANGTAPKNDPLVVVP